MFALWRPTWPNRNAFYTEQLGMAKAFNFVRADRKIGFYLQAGDTTFLEVFARSEAQDSDLPLLNHFCLEVDDLDLTIQTLNEADVKVSPKKLGADNAWQAWITDPSGVRIELMQYTAGSTQFTGQSVVLD